ncbi:hypothetical protein BDA96_02G145400 [Sorghum bicolor]|uniref:Uncharacterized protein n=2 Tax=Sorghum bicolor TaxID=4558 RepID=A0A1W0W3Z4_SORBI|nr:hypothetical protein BDA96_02G145400 [Sorghum bicolor]OQU89055.1 hypothetical protein SORBI_3002G139750 [Sorghum bicolor]
MCPTHRLPLSLPPFPICDLHCYPMLSNDLAPALPTRDEDRGDSYDEVDPSPPLLPPRPPPPPPPLLVLSPPPPHLRDVVGARGSSELEGDGARGPKQPTPRTSYPCCLYVFFLLFLLVALYFLVVVIDEIRIL